MMMIMMIMIMMIMIIVNLEDDVFHKNIGIRVQLLKYFVRCL